MPLPTKERTWQYLVNQAIAAQASLIETNRVALLAMKNSLLAFPTSPWTVVGSCDATTAGMDAVDRWLTTSNLVWSTAAARSWIVLSQPGLAPLQVCIELRSTASNNWLVGFSASGAYAGGSTTTRPSAADEVVVNNGAAWASSSNIPCVVHAMQSVDGLGTRLIMCAAGNSIGLFFVERPGDVPAPLAGFPGWSTPVLVHAGANAAGAVFATHVTYNDNAACYGYANAGSMACYLTEEGFVSSMLGEQFAVTANELSGEWPMAQAGVASTAAGRRGRHGRMVDLWWGSTVHSDGTTYPADGTRSFVQFGHIIHPWNGTIPQMV